MARKSAVARFFEKINFDGPVPPLHPDMSPCWIWTAGKTFSNNNNRWGKVVPIYGKIYVDGSYIRAHRFMFEYANGRKLEEWELVNHKCHVTLCVNPMHLEATDLSGNMRDTAAKAAAALAERMAA